MEGDEVHKRNFKVKFVNGDPDISVEVNDTDTVAVILQKVRTEKGLPETKNVRLIGGGRELYGDNPVNTVSGVLHCTVSDFRPKRVGMEKHNRANVDRPRLDWFDMVDPGVVLMWIFGLMLGLFWLLFFFCGYMFDHASIATLALMTLAFIVPCAASHIPWPDSWSLQVAPPTPDPAATTGYSTSVHTGDVHRRGVHVPPRPEAPVRGPTT